MKPRHGSANPNAKLTDAQIHFLRRINRLSGIHDWFRHGWKKKLAHRWGVCPAAITHAIQRKTWAQDNPPLAVS